MRLISVSPAARSRPGPPGGPAQPPGRWAAITDNELLRPASEGLHLRFLFSLKLNLKRPVSREDRGEFILPVQNCVVHVSRLIFSGVSGESLLRNSFTAPAPQPSPPSPGPPAAAARGWGPSREKAITATPRPPRWTGGRRKSRAFHHMGSLTGLSSFIPLGPVFCVFRLCQPGRRKRKWSIFLLELAHGLQPNAHSTGLSLLVFEPTNWLSSRRGRAGLGCGLSVCPGTCHRHAHSRGLCVITAEGRTEGDGCVETALSWSHSLYPSSVSSSIFLTPLPSCLFLTPQRRRLKQHIALALTPVSAVTPNPSLLCPFLSLRFPRSPW